MLCTTRPAKSGILSAHTSEDGGRALADEDRHAHRGGPVAHDAATVVCKTDPCAFDLALPAATLQLLGEFDDLCDGVRPCCTLAADGPTKAIDAFAFELKKVLGDEGYEEFRQVAGTLEEERAAKIRASSESK